MPMSNSL